MNHSKILGDYGETCAVRYLKKNRYHILCRNYICRFGEADIICEQGNLLVFVEVKTRSNDVFARPGYAVNAAKRAKYYRISQSYCLLKKQFERVIRYDIIEVVNGEVLHIENAF